MSSPLDSYEQFMTRMGKRFPLDRAEAGQKFVGEFLLVGFLWLVTPIVLLGMFVFAGPFILIDKLRTRKTE